jgi:hypothetical protein
MILKQTQALLFIKRETYDGNGEFGRHTLQVFRLRDPERDHPKVADSPGRAADLRVEYARLMCAGQRKAERLCLRENQTRPGLPGVQDDTFTFHERLQRNSLNRWREKRR